MPTPADQRLLELLDKWLSSLELHTKYSSLDDDSYWKIQPWVEHQRPSRWILDLAKQKTVALRAQVEQRIKTGDQTFSDALELMTFLANLVGSEHIERFIPVADAQSERPVQPAPADDAPTVQISTVTATREMPPFLASKSQVPPPAASNQVARSERKAPASKSPAKSGAKQAGRPVPGGKARAPSEAAREQVVADAVRLVQWGRKWYELPELIARMADRPTLPEVRRILKENKSTIDERARVA